jgi:hypothetical protein
MYESGALQEGTAPAPNGALPPPRPGGSAKDPWTCVGDLTVRERVALSLLLAPEPTSGD